MRKIIAIFAILSVFLCACSGGTSTPTEPNAALSPDPQNEREYEVYYHAQEEAVAEIESAAAAQWERYVSVDDLVEVLREYYGDEADEMRDMIIHGGDLELYETEDILEKVLGECSFEP